MLRTSTIRPTDDAQGLTKLEIEKRLITVFANNLCKFFISEVLEYSVFFIFDVHYSTDSV